MADNIKPGFEDDGFRFVGGDPKNPRNWEPVELKIGTVDGGYRFLGGDPRNQKNWEDVRDAGMLERAKQGLASTVSAGQIAATDDPARIAGLIAEEQRTRLPQTPTQQKMAAEIKPYQEEYEQSSGIGAVGSFAKLAAKRLAQFVSNPSELAGAVAENLPNSAPGLAGGIVGGKGGAMAGTVVAPGAGTVVGGVGGAIVGGTAGGYFIEQGAAMRDQILKAAQELGVDPRDPAALEPLIQARYADFLEKSRLKGIGTAGTDAVLNALTFGVAGAGERVLAKEARALTEGVKAGTVDTAQAATQLASIEARQAARNTLPARAVRGTGIVGAEMAGEGLSEAAGQKLAYGQVDPLDVVDESILGLGQGVGMAAGQKVYNRVTGQPTVDTVDRSILSAQDAISRQRQGVATQQLDAAQSAGEAIAAANNLAGSVDELTAAVDQYLSAGVAKNQQIETPQAAAAAVDTSMPAMRARADREAGLLAEAAAAGTDFERQMALEQAATVRGEAAPRTAESFVDLTPMDERQAGLRLRVMQDMAANEGGNALDLAVVPHPSQAGRFAIGRVALPSLELGTTTPDVAPADAQSRIESAALAGDIANRRAEDAPRQVVLNRAFQAVQERGGVASPAEARIFQEAGVGQPYDRIDPNLAPALTTDEKLTQATGIALESTPRESGGESQRLAAIEQANAESMTEQAARAAANRDQAARETLQQIEQTSQPATAPDANEVIDALRTPGAQRSAEQVSTVRQAQARYSASDFSILERAASGPFQLNAPERMRLDTLTKGVAPTQQTTAEPVAQETPPLMGSRVAERLGLSSQGRVVTSGAKLSTTRTMTPGVTQTIKDGDTEHNFTIVDTGRLGVQGRLLQQIARIFGKRLVAFDSDTLAADGFVLDDDNRSIFINARGTQMSPLAVFGHELTHLLKRDNPAAYAALEAVVQREMSEGAMAEFEQYYGQGANLEEITSDLVGNRFQEADFWQAVFDEIAAQNAEGARGIITRLVAAINKAVNAFLKVVRQPGFEKSDQLVSDLNAIKAAAKQALATYAQSQRETAMRLEGETAQAEAQVNLTSTGYDSDANEGTRNARFSEPRRGEGVPGAAGQDGQRAGEDGGGEVPSYGTAREGAISVLARHYSREPRQSLSGAFYGRGLKGAERTRLEDSTDPRLRQRVYFYVDQGRGIRPEAGVGGYAHEVQLNNIYDPATRLIPSQPNVNAFESAVINAGFDGYIAPFTVSQSAVVLLGPRHSAVPVRALSSEEAALRPVRNSSLSRQRTIDLASLDESNKLAQTKAWPKGRELKMAMQQRVLDAAMAAGLDITQDSPETRAYLRDVGLRDALVALKQNPNAIGWYDLKTRQALAVMSLVHPEIARDENARFAFTWALAVTSNGLKVGKNFELAEQAYEQYKRTGSMPTDIGIGTAGGAINDSLALFNELRDAWGIDNLRQFMQTNFTVSEITGISKALKPGGEHADVTVKGAAIIGPKIGNGFFSNLYGNFDSLTMDRWLIRTWGRWTGTLIKPMPEQTAKARDRLSANMRQILADPAEAKRLGDLVGTEINAETDTDVLAAAVQKASMDPDIRAQLNETPAGLELRKAGNGLAKYLDGQKEAPANPDERKYIRAVFGEILAELQQTPAYKDLTMADLQAVLWYAEKRLYETAKENPEELAADEDVEGYADDEAPDYANAAADVARSKNVTERRINAALRKVENERSGTAGSAAAGGNAPGQAVGAGQQRTPGGFTRQEKKRFIGERAVLRARADRAGNAQQPGSYERDSGKDSGRVRVLKSLGVRYTDVWKLAQKAGTIFRANEIAAPEFLELARTPENAQKFQAAISENKANLKFGAAVYVYPAEDYQAMRLFLTKDGKSGVAIKPDGDIVSVFSTGGAGRAVMELAVSAGGRKLDAFDTILPEFYAPHGFRAVARTRWNDEFAPSEWNKDTFREFNNGEPDVVFMVYDPAKTDAEYSPRDGRVMQGEDGYDRAVATQNREMRRVRRDNPNAQLSRQRQTEAAQEYAEVERKYRNTPMWLKAPNGQDTNLTERQWVQVRTPSFKAWFGDWEKFAKMGAGVWSDDNNEVSKVVDANGEPLVVYHGAPVGGFSVFKTPGGTRRGDLGIWTSSNLEMAKTYRKGNTGEIEFENMDREELVPGDNAEPVSGYYVSFMNLRNPYETDFEGAYWNGERPGQYVVMKDDEQQYTPDGKGYFDLFDDANEFAKTVDGDVQPAPEHYETTDSAVKEARRNKNDGAIIRAVVDSGSNVRTSYIDEPSDVFVAFDPNQLKSATQNTGEFGADTDDMRFSRRRNIFGQQVLSNWSNLGESKMDDFLYTMQDKQIDTRRVVEAIRQAAGGISDKWNAYLQEELFHGRTAKQTANFLNDELRPLLQEMQARGVSMEELEEYLHNRHAEERNDQIAKVNPNMPDGGSGIDTADARAYLANLSQAQLNDFQALARRVDAITAGTRQLLVSSGLETQDTVDAWENTYGSYVPLFREDTDFAAGGGAGTGQGYSVRGPASRRATGSSRPVVDILANLAMQRERTIVRAEKARVAQAVYGMAVQNPNTDFWLAIDPEGQKDPQKAIADLVSMGINPIDAQNIIEEPVQQTVDPRTGLVVQRVNPLLRNSDNVLAVRIGGRERYVFFNANDERAQRMVGALKNLDADQLGRVMSMMAMVTRYFASINTQYNPIFGVINLARDTQGAAFNLTTTPIADRKRQVMGDIMPALRGIYSDLRSRRAGKGPATGTWATLWEEFQNEGGQTGFRDQFSKSAERAEALERELKKISEGKAKQFGRAVFDWLSDYNETLENAVRLAAYKAAKDKGISNQQAASIAKNLTVNFNRKGQVAAQAGALYAFFNASVQGTKRLAETLTGPAGKKIVAGGLLLGTAQALLLAAAGFDEDEPPDFVKERNLVIPLPNGKYLTVPMPLGFNVIPNTSRVLTEYALSGWRDPSKRVGQIAGAFLEMFNPIGNAGWSVQTIAPTIADPLVALAENRDWTGKPIAKNDRSDLAPTPGYTRAKETASWLGKQMSYYLNLASGGSKYKPGLISPTPDQIDYLIGQATGGVGRELLKVEQTVTSTVTGEELPTYKVPLVGRFYGDTKSGAAESERFYENLKRINEHEAEIKGRQKNREGGISDYVRDNPEARLVNQANQAEKDVQGLRRMRRELLEKNAEASRVKLVEERIKMRMKQFNDRVRRLREAEPVE